MPALLEGHLVGIVTNFRADPSQITLQIAVAIVPTKFELQQLGRWTVDSVVKDTSLGRDVNGIPFSKYAPGAYYRHSNVLLGQIKSNQGAYDFRQRDREAKARLGRISKIHSKNWFDSYADFKTVSGSGIVDLIGGYGAPHMLEQIKMTAEQGGGLYHTEGNRVTVFYEDGEKGQLAVIHNEGLGVPRREFFGLRPEAGPAAQDFLAQLMKRRTGL